MKIITSRNLQFRQLIKIISKAESLAVTNKLETITDEIIRGILNEE